MQKHRPGGYGWVVCLATLGPIGKSPIAPGTAGSLAGFVVYLVIAFLWIPSAAIYWTLCVVLPLLAVPICHRAEELIGRKDPAEVVLDEFAVAPLCFLGTVTPSKIGDMSSLEISAWSLVGFALFRFFDIIKPLGIRASQRLPNGWGVVVDDVLAALFVCGCLNLGWRWLGLGA
jgi:phosphatidylglycerophosphatase A